jgi:hypothetical protein
MWDSKADLTQIDTLVFLNGTSSRLHDTINSHRQSKGLETLKWDSIPGNYERGLMWDFRCEEILTGFLDTKKVHYVFGENNDYCECEGVYVDDIIGDRVVNKILNKEGGGYMFTSFAVYGDIYFFLIVTEINGQIRDRLIKFE